MAGVKMTRTQSLASYREAVRRAKAAYAASSVALRGKLERAVMKAQRRYERALAVTPPIQPIERARRGGRARAKYLNEESRKESARNAATARWNKRKKEAAA